MECRDLLIDGYGRIKEILDRTVQGLTLEQLTYRPEEEANTIAWLTWHLSRVQDGHMSDLIGTPQAWVSEGWHAKFDKPANPADTGFRYTADQVAAVRPASAQLLAAYHEAVYARTVNYLKGLSTTDLDRVLNEPQWNPMPTLGVRLISVLSDNLQHAGQAAYLRGIIERRHWFPA